MRCLVPVLLLAFLPAHGWAEDAGDARILKSEYCFGFEGFAKQGAKFAKLKAERRDTVGPVLEFVFHLESGERPPERMELRNDGEVIASSGFTTAPEGDGGLVARSMNFGEAGSSAPETSRMCVVDPAREGRVWGEHGYRHAFGYGVRWLATPGTHSVAELEDGLKDGRRHWKTMAGAMGFMVPTFDHVAVASDERDNPPAVTALKDGAAIGAVEGEFYDGARMVPLEALEEMGADAIRVEAEYYRLTPSPDAKTVARFAGGDDG